MRSPGKKSIRSAGGEFVCCKGRVRPPPPSRPSFPLSHKQKKSDDLVHSWTGWGMGGKRTIRHQPDQQLSKLERSSLYTTGSVQHDHVVYTTARHVERKDLIDADRSICLLISQYPVLYIRVGRYST